MFETFLIFNSCLETLGVQWTLVNQEFQIYCKQTFGYGKIDPLKTFKYPSSVKVPRVRVMKT